MANRRMFSKAIIGSARFMRMPASARLLYYDLGMYADDDGVVEAFPVMRMTGASDDDLKVLVAKEFVRILNEDLVSLILDWNINNQVRKDRYVPSIYRSLLTSCQPTVNQRSTNVQPTVNQPETQYSIVQDNLVKDNIVEDSTVKPSAPPADNDDFFKSFLKQFDPAIVEWAMIEASSHGQDKNRKYIYSILNRIRNQGLKTLPEVLKAEEAFKKTKVVPINNHGYQTHEYTEDDFNESFYVNFQKP